MARQSISARTTSNIPSLADEEALLPPLEWSTEEEWRDLIDRAARHHLGMSGEEFVRAWEGGQFDGEPDRPEVMSVAMLLPRAE